MRIEKKVDLTALEFELLADIDQQAEQVRGLFITNTPSQPAVYLQKEAEAEAFMADQNIAPALIPNLVREAARTGETLFDVAVVILTQAQFWREKSAQIEDLRLGAKEQVRAATTVAGKRAAAKVEWLV